MIPAVWRAAGALLPPLLALLAPAAAVAQSVTLPEIVVTPYYSPTLLADTGSSLTVIRGDQIARSSPASLTQVLRSVPGVTVIESGGPGATTEVRLRGAETGHTLVLIDGVRVNDVATARDDFDFSLIAPSEIERIEVLRGPQSAVYGSDAMGGVINIITKRAARDRNTASVSVEGGSYGTNAEKLSASMSRGDFSLRFGGSHYFTGGFSRRGHRDANEPDAYRKWAGSFRAEYAPEGGPKLEVGGNGSSVFSEYDAASGSGAADALNTVNKLLLSGFARLSWTGDTGFDHSLMAFANGSARDNIERAPPKPSIPESHFRSGSVGAEYKATMAVGWGDVLVGGRIEREGATYNAPSGGFSTFDSASVLYAVFAEQKVAVGDRLNLAFNVRYDGSSGEEGFITGRATAVYDLTETGTRLKASIGTGAKRPTAYMIANNQYQALVYPDVSTDLSPERSFGVDAGVEQDLWQGRGRFTVTGFYNRFRDLLDTRTLGGSFDVAYDNVSHAMTAGAEISGEFDLIPDRLTVGGTYTYLYTEDSNGKPLRRRPRNAGSVSVSMVPAEGAKLTGTAVYVGERFNSNGGVSLLPAYWRVDLEGSLSLNPRTETFARVENLFNAQYQDPGGFNTPGLSAYVGLRWAN